MTDLIKNIKNQDDGLDYFINDLKTNTKTITTDIINDEYFSDRKKPLFFINLKTIKLGINRYVKNAKKKKEETEV